MIEGKCRVCGNKRAVAGYGDRRLCLEHYKQYFIREHDVDIKGKRRRLCQSIKAPNILARVLPKI